MPVPVLSILAGILWGNELAQFETEFATHCGVKHAIGVANGLDALILVLRAWKELLASPRPVMRSLFRPIIYIASVLAITENDLRRCWLSPMRDTYNPSILHWFAQP